MNATEKIAKSVSRSQLFAQAVPGNMAGYFEFIQTGFANAAPLDVATLQLIIVASGVARGSEDAIYQHVKMFRDAGGSREALVSGLNAVVMACGGTAWGLAGLALEVYNELAAAE